MKLSVEPIKNVFKTIYEEIKEMKKSKVSLIVVVIFILMSCAPTIATKSITETTHPDGSKTVSVTKSLSQQFSLMETSSTKEVKETFK